eukprot:gene12583-biopygen7898
MIDQSAGKTRLGISTGFEFATPANWRQPFLRQPVFSHVVAVVARAAWRLFPERSIGSPAPSSNGKYAKRSTVVQ